MFAFSHFRDRHAAAINVNQPLWIRMVGQQSQLSIVSMGWNEMWIRQTVTNQFRTTLFRQILIRGDRLH